MFEVRGLVEEFHEVLGEGLVSLGPGAGFLDSLFYHLMMID